MMKIKKYYLFLWLIFHIIIIGAFIIIPCGRVLAASNIDQAITFDECQSTDPGNPVSLDVGIPVTGQSYVAPNSYYYKTSSNAGPGRYHIIWLQPSNNKDFDLYIYTDAGFSNLLASSVRINDALEWVVFRPSSSKQYFVNVTAVDSGTGVIEWEDSSDAITPSTPKSLNLDPNNAIEVYEANLVASSTYTFYLDTPAGANYDLYLYRIAQGGSANSEGFIRKSDVGGNGGDETISDYSPNANVKVVVLVVRNSGTGIFTLTLSETPGTSASPTEDSNLWLFPVIELPIFFGVTFGLVGLIYLHRYLKNRMKPAREN